LRNGACTDGVGREVLGDRLDRVRRLGRPENAENRWGGVEGRVAVLVELLLVTFPAASCSASNRARSFLRSTVSQSVLKRSVTTCSSRDNRARRTLTLAIYAQATSEGDQESARRLGERFQRL
jgi:hypothetical protein